MGTLIVDIFCVPTQGGVLYQAFIHSGFEIGRPPIRLFSFHIDEKR